jgi:hypothetical protein
MSESLPVNIDDIAPPNVANPPITVVAARFVPYNIPFTPFDKTDCCAPQASSLLDP